MGKSALIFGVGGQDGALLARLLLRKGYRVNGTTRDREIASLNNLKRLEIFGQVDILSASLGDFRSVAQAINNTSPDEIYNLAAQSSVALSFDQPAETIDSSVSGTINILEAMRLLGSRARFYNASSSECFGNTPGEPADENTPFRPCSPYGVAKAAAHWLVANYRNAYGLLACSGILFNHESPLRPARYVTQKIIQGALDIAEGKIARLTLGQLDVERDWGWAPEYVEAMWGMLQLDQPDDFVIATGQTHRLSDFVRRAFDAVGLEWETHVVCEPSLQRPLDIKTSKANPDKARRVLRWSAATDFSTIISRMIDAEQNRRRGAATNF
jgi:GDPmannose 4,6-dehydratase